MGEQRVVLKDRIHPAPVWRQNIEPFVFHPDFARGRALEARNDAQQCRLARTAFSQDGQKFAFRNLQGDIAQHRMLPKRLCDIANGEQRLRARFGGTNNCGFGRGSHLSWQRRRFGKVRLYPMNTTVPPSLHSRFRCTSLSAERSARSTGASDNCPRHPNADSLLARQSCTALPADSPVCSR